jgi:AraC-like DNA-binding protein
LRQLILAAVPAERIGRLRAADEGFRFVAVRGWSEAFEVIRQRPVEMAVVDPTLGGEPRSHEIERLRLLFPSLPLLVYTVLEPRTAGVLLSLGRSGVKRALFHPFDDSPTALRAALTAELEQSASQQVMQSMAGLLGELPAQLHAGLEAMLCVGICAGTVGELAFRAQLERRTCERWFVRAGLPSPKVVLTALRLLYAHRLLLDPGHTVEDVALKLGYGKVKTMQAHCREVFGVTAGELRISLTMEEATEAVTRRYFARQRGASRQGSPTRRAAS